MTIGSWLLSTGVLAATSLLLGVAAPAGAARLRPRSATWILSAGSLLVAAGSVAVPLLLVGPLLGQWAPVASAGHWSAAWLRSSPQSQSGAGVVALGVLIVQVGLLLRWAWRCGRPLLAAWRESARTVEPLVVLPDPAVAAFAVPGWPGRIVATSGLLDGLAAGPRRAVLAHEQAHLDGHHDLHLMAAELAAAVNPLMTRVPAAVRLSTERWADEVAAASVSDRRLVAETIGRVAAGSHQLGSGHLFALGAAGADVVQRVGSLLARPPRPRPFLEGLLMTLILASVVATVLAAYDTHHLFEAAERVYLAGPVH